MPTIPGLETTLVHGLSKLAAKAADRLRASAPATAATSSSEGARQDLETGGAVHAPPDAPGDRLTAVFGHELRGRIAPMKNAAELLRRASLDHSTRLKVAELIDRQIDAMTRLVDEMLASTQTKTLRPKLRRSDVSVESLVKLSIECIEPLASIRRQVLLVRLPEACFHITADEMWLGQALQNVLNNAVKYTDTGGRIEVDVTHDPPYAVISVRDTGVGLAATHIETIFDLYAQVAQPPSRPAAGGLGVGLHVAKWVIEAHGGSIHALSPGLGGGTTLVIRLPCRSAEPPLR
jgi:signal transduction histidine kinase